MTATLCCVILCSACTVQSKENPLDPLSYAPYVPLVQAAMDEDLYNVGNGALFDIDGNGVDELILAYDQNFETETGTYPCHVCSLYTINGGQPVALLEKEHLYAVAGGPSAFVGVVNIDGSNQFVHAYETGDTGNFDGKLRYGEWKLYQIDGRSAIQMSHVEFEKCLSYDRNGNESIIYDASGCKFDDVEKPFQDYETWYNSLEKIFILESASERNHSLPLKELLTQLTGEVADPTPAATSDLETRPALIDAQQPTDSTWKQLYAQYIQEHDHLGVSQYQLIDLNNDSIPELLVDHMIIAYGSDLCTVSGNQLYTLHISSGGLSYLPQQNLCLDSGGRMDTYYDAIYTLDNGQFVQLHRGEYTIDYQQIGENGEPACFCFWDGANVSKEEYSETLTAIFPKEAAVQPYADMMDAAGILSAIASK